MCQGLDIRYQLITGTDVDYSRVSLVLFFQNTRSNVQLLENTCPHLWNPNKGRKAHFRCDEILYLSHKQLMLGNKKEENPWTRPKIFAQQLNSSKESRTHCLLAEYGPSCTGSFACISIQPHQHLKQLSQFTHRCETWWFLIIFFSVWLDSVVSTYARSEHKYKLHMFNRLKCHQQSTVRKPAKSDPFFSARPSTFRFRLRICCCSWQYSAWKNRRKHNELYSGYLNFWRTFPRVKTSNPKM